MRALSLTQPWASLVALGEKRIETRSWPTSYRGPLAIHASKGFPKPCRDLCVQEPFATAFRRAGLGGHALLNPAKSLPLGSVIAVCNLSSVMPSEMIQWPNGPSHAAAHEEAFGDYSPGRFLWVLEDVVALETPQAASGALGLWQPQPGLDAILEAYAPPWVPLEERP